jgi:hypothetical protein
MERVKVKIAGASKALARLREITGIDEVPAITRDAAIQRFEFTFEAIWKVAKMYLREIVFICNFGINRNESNNLK